MQLFAMGDHRLLPFLSLLAVVLPGCAGKPASDPWLVPREKFLADTRTIASGREARPPEMVAQPQLFGSGAERRKFLSSE
jgi:hypothetical protein